MISDIGAILIDSIEDAASATRKLNRISCFICQM